jgi:twitching motility protein PilT
LATANEILTEAMKWGASDVHLVPGLPPMFRVNTVLAAAPGFQKVTPEETEQFVKESVGRDRFEEFHDRRDIDFSAHLEALGRFRVNGHYQRGCIAVSLRAIRESVPSMAELNLPTIVDSLINLHKGLVLVTGPTGSGKSTTLASMIDAMNHRYQHHIITLEDPVEYELRTERCVIEQREMGIDVPTFASGLRHALRQDPDVILVGEMRDLETTSAAITAAETGHLVLSTLHTSSASLTVERIIDIYPGPQQNQVRTMLANTLEAVISMRLFRRLDRDGMIPACEIMICTPAVRNCIRENRIHEIPNIIVTGRGAGMCTMADAIRDLHANGLIAGETPAAQQAENEPEFESAMAM